MDELEKFYMRRIKDRIDIKTYNEKLDDIRYILHEFKCLKMRLFSYDIMIICSTINRNIIYSKITETEIEIKKLCQSVIMHIKLMGRRSRERFTKILQTDNDETKYFDIIKTSISSC